MKDIYCFKEIKSKLEIFDNLIELFELIQVEEGVEEKCGEILQILESY